MDFKDRLAELRKVQDTPIRMWVQALIEFKDGKAVLVKHFTFPAKTSGAKFKKNKVNKKMVTKKEEVEISEGGGVFD